MSSNIRAKPPETSIVIKGKLEQLWPLILDQIETKLLAYTILGRQT
jgi:hypothetical protein